MVVYFLLISEQDMQERKSFFLFKFTDTQTGLKREEEKRGVKPGLIVCLYWCTYWIFSRLAKIKPGKTYAAVYLSYWLTHSLLAAST